MTRPGYGVSHRGRVLRASAQPNAWEVEVTSLASNRTFGPCEATVSPLAAGDRVLLTQIGLSVSDLVIVGKLPPDLPGATLPITMADVTGLPAALSGLTAALSGLTATLSGLTTALADKQPLDPDLTAIATLTPANGDIIQRVLGVWVNRTIAQLKTDLALVLSDVSGLVTALSGKQPLDADLTTIAGLTATTDSVMQAKAGAWSARTPAQLKTDLAIVQADVSGLVTALAALQPLDSDLTAIAALTPTNDDVVQRKSGAWTNRTPAQLKTDLAIVQADVSGLVAALANLASLGADFQTTNGTTGSTTYTATFTGGTACGLAFTAPTSGKVEIFNDSEISNTGGFTYVTVRVRTGAVVGSGSDVLAAGDENAVFGTPPIRAGCSVLVTGLVAGNSYNAQQMIRVNASTGTAGKKRLRVRGA
jgi:hypothetical protein